MEFLENRDPKLFIFLEKYQTETEEVVVYCAQCIKICKFVQKYIHCSIQFAVKGLTKLEINGILKEQRSKTVLSLHA